MRQFVRVTIALSAWTSWLAVASLCAQDPPATKEPAEDQRSRPAADGRDKPALLLAKLAAGHGYRLAPERAVCRVAPPFADLRLECYRRGVPRQAGAIPNGPAAMVFRQAERQLHIHGMSFSSRGGYSIEHLIAALIGIRGQWVEGGSVRDSYVPGDWVVRDGATDEQIVEELAAILRDELSLDVSMEFRQIVRPLYVVRGTYSFKRLPGGRTREETVLSDGTWVDSDPIEVFGKQLVPSSTLTHFDDFDRFVAALADWIDEPIISDVKVPPKRLLSWKLHRRSPSTYQSRAEDRDANLVLSNITAQTGLTFTIEQRPVKTLFVEGAR